MYTCGSVRERWSAWEILEEPDPFLALILRPDLDAWEPPLLDTTEDPGVWYESLSGEEVDALDLLRYEFMMSVLFPDGRRSKKQREKYRLKVGVVALLVLGLWGS